MQCELLGWNIFQPAPIKSSSEAQIGVEGFKRMKKKTQSWVGGVECGESGFDSSEAVNMIKIHCMKFSKN